MHVIMTISYFDVLNRVQNVVECSVEGFSHGKNRLDASRQNLCDIVAHKIMLGHNEENNRAKTSSHYLADPRTIVCGTSETLIRHPCSDASTCTSMKQERMVKDNDPDEGSAKKWKEARTGDPGKQAVVDAECSNTADQENADEDAKIMEEIVLARSPRIRPASIPGAFAVGLRHDGSASLASRTDSLRYSSRSSSDATLPTTNGSSQVPNHGSSIGDDAIIEIPRAVLVEEATVVRAPPLELAELVLASRDDIDAPEARGLRTADGSKEIQSDKRLRCCGGGKRCRCLCAIVAALVIAVLAAGLVAVWLGNSSGKNALLRGRPPPPEHYRNATNGTSISAYYEGDGQGGSLQKGD